MLEVSGVSNYGKTANVNFGRGIKKYDDIKDLEDVKYLAATQEGDSFEQEHLIGNRGLSKADKQQILHDARSKAAGWAIFGEGISTLYYALRSDKKIAHKFDLDPLQDKKLIEQIRRDQTIATIPAAIPGLGSLWALGTYIYCKVQAPEDITVKG